jgi:hypothetical protein
MEKTWDQRKLTPIGMNFVFKYSTGECFVEKSLTQLHCPMVQYWFEGPSLRHKNCHFKHLSARRKQVSNNTYLGHLSASVVQGTIRTTKTRRHKEFKGLVQKSYRWRTHAWN